MVKKLLRFVHFGKKNELESEDYMLLDLPQDGEIRRYHMSFFIFSLKYFVVFCVRALMVCCVKNAIIEDLRSIHIQPKHKIIKEK